MACPKVAECNDHITEKEKYASVKLQEQAQPEAPVAADDATLRRWKNWFHEQSAYWFGTLCGTA